MKYTHHQLEYEIDESWLIEAGVVGFKPQSDHYHAKSNDDVFRSVPAVLGFDMSDPYA